MANKRFLAVEKLEAISVKLSNDEESENGCVTEGKPGPEIYVELGESKHNGAD